MEEHHSISDEIESQAFGKAGKAHISHPLVLPLAMRDLAGCFANQAVRVAGATCPATTANSPGVLAESSPAYNTVTCLYKTVLSTKKELLTRIIWSKTHAGVSLFASVDSSSSPSSDAQKPQLLHKKKGTRSFAAGGGDSVAVLHWDISAAAYESGPEPAKGFYVAVVADGEFGLLLGDRLGVLFKNLGVDGPLPATADFAMVGRREQVRGTSVYSTRAELEGDGKKHEISIRWRGDESDAADSGLQVAVDRKTLISVERLRWNFRGNQAIFVDGSTIDVMWDVHDWWFRGSSRCALFMFRARRSLEQWLWLDEEEVGNGERGFSLLIQAFN
ncbi:hypothetical protein Cni_G24818 [Canna indica]|uniref:Uncharacterized protein n=1 Tax=Canna indica TaxID=4628 RepID=A0AAQ3QNV2_9LILI|nr:hypothetical protein Cni_G24818 [Canna indica]